MYGLLYNWYAINDVNFTPNNWKIPTTEEFDILFSYADNQQHINILKSSVGWPNGYNGYDGFGFRGLPAGSRETSFHDLGLFSNWWTSSMILTSPLRRTFVWNEPMVQSYGSYKYNGNSVRLLWSGTGTPPATITDYDGNIYNVLQIGTQYWLNKNWKCTHLKNGTLIPNVTNQSTWNSLLTGACCAYDNDNSKV